MLLTPQRWAVLALLRVALWREGSLVQRVSRALHELVSASIFPAPGDSSDRVSMERKNKYYLLKKWNQI